MGTNHRLDFDDHLLWLHLVGHPSRPRLAARLLQELSTDVPRTTPHQPFYSFVFLVFIFVISLFLEAGLSFFFFFTSLALYHLSLLPLLRAQHHHAREAE